MALKSRKKHGEGNYCLMKSDIDDISITDFQNPWTFHNLFTQPDDVLFRWLTDQGLLAETIICETGEVAKINKRKKSKDNYSFRCKNGHEYGMRKNSFFEGSAYNIRDLVIFIKYYIEGHTLHQCALSTGMDYKSTAVNWASYIRELFMEHIHKQYETMKFNTDVEIDESLFGRKIKYNRGRPGGQKIWIFGMVERLSNLIILYPVDNRDAATLIPLIQKHVAVGTRIFSDNWAAYFKLNELGYEHFTVTHKTTFRQVYKNIDTGEYVTCNTNRIEGAWKISKDHFRKINGTNTKLFEQHLAEIVWRNHIHKDNIYDSFFSLLKSVYTLDFQPVYQHPVPLFGTWTPPSQADEEAHSYTIIQDPDENATSDEEILSDAGTDQTDEPGPLSEDTSNPASIVSLSVSPEAGPSVAPNNSQDSTLNITAIPSLTPSASSTPLPVVKSKSAFHESDYETDDDSKTKHCHPLRFVTLRRKKKSSEKRKPAEKQNIYGKKGFLFDFESSDSDFV